MNAQMMSIRVVDVLFVSKSLILLYDMVFINVVKIDN
jgi:hypothetical protein